MSDNAFLATLPEDLRSEPSLATIADTASLAKGYVHAQKLIGAKRLVAPDEKWTDQQWNEFYDAVGRPKTHADYKLPDVKLEEGVTLDEAKKAATLEKLHKLGLTQRQAAGVLEHYLTSINEGVRTSKAHSMAQRSEGERALRDEWGDKFEGNLDVARSVIKKFGGDQAGDMQKWLDESGMGDNVHLARLFHKIGLEFMEDQRRGGGGGDLPVGDVARAQQEIEVLKTDEAFTKALTDPRNVGHRAAVDRWINLHEVAAKGERTE